MGCLLFSNASLHTTYKRQNQTAKEEPQETHPQPIEDNNAVVEQNKDDQPVIKKKRKKSMQLLTNEEKGKREEITLKTLYQKYFIGTFTPQPPKEAPFDPNNELERYTKKDKWIDRLVKLKLIEPRGDWRERQKQTMIKKGGIQTNLGTSKIGRALSSSENVKRKYGAKKRATKEYIYTEVHKYYKVFGGLVTMRHWRVEEWFGVPVKLWIFVYLVFAGLIAFSATYYFNTPRLIEKDEKIANDHKTAHVQFVIDKLRSNEKIRQHLGEITDPKLSKLPPADRNNFRARFVHELWAQSEIEGLIRIVLIYDTEQSLEGLYRMEVHLDEEIIRVDFEDEDARDLDSLQVVRCPPDLFPLMHWFTQSRREIFSAIPYYIWPIAPIGCLLALARWHYRSPPGLANYVLDQLKNHVIVRRTLGSPVHLQSDQWKGRLTMRSCNMRVLLEGSKHSGKVSVIGYRDGSTRWLFPNSVMTIDGVKHDHYREIHIAPFEIPQNN